MAWHGTAHVACPCPLWATLLTRWGPGLALNSSAIRRVPMPRLADQSVLVGG